MRINPKLKSLAAEDYSKRDGNLFGPGFLEKANKKLEMDKTLIPKNARAKWCSGETQQNSSERSHSMLLDDNLLIGRAKRAHTLGCSI